nr:MFS transporter [Streptomyces avicenniae]
MSLAPSTLDPKRWTALIFIALAQLMVVLDGTIVNIALPSAQADLGISDANRQWVITAYALAFGGLLLFGGRISDMWGRRRAFVIGLIGFALASALGGAAQNEAMMFGSRALQGVFGALLAPASLSLLTVLFTDAKERAKAFGVFGAIAGAGAAVGLLLGGALTDYLDWRWTFFVNIPFAVVAAVGAILTVTEPESARNHARLDVPGVILASSGLVALVYAFTRAEQESWGESLTVATFIASGVLLALFVLVESRVRSPLLPLRVVSDRNRGGAYLSLGLAIVGMFGLFLFLTYYLQVVRDYSPVRTGVAFLPMVAGMIIGSTQIGARLVMRVPPRALMVPGLLVASLGMLILTQLEPDSSYVTIVLPAEILLGLGMGTSFMPAMSLATERIRPTDAGIASAMVNVSQQVGGAIGTAALNTVAASATASYAVAHRATATDPQSLEFASMVHGYTSAIWWAFGILVAAAASAALLINSKGHGGNRGAATEDGAEDNQPVPVLVH